MYYGRWLREVVDALNRLSAVPEQIKKIEDRIEQHKEIVAAANANNDENEQIRQRSAEKVFAANQAAENERANRDDRSYGVQRSIKAATWIAAIGAVVYGFVAMYQACLMRKATEAATRSAAIAVCALKENQKQFSDTLAQIKAQTKAQVTSAKAAGIAVGQSEKFFDLQNRPWLIFMPGPIHTDSVSKQVYFEVSVKNVGVTPAPSVWSRVHYEVGQSTPKEFRFTGSDQIATQPFAAQEAIRYSNSIPFSSVPAFGPAASVYGWIVYRDLFKGTPLHLTEFGAVVTTNIVELTQPPPTTRQYDHPLTSVRYWEQIHDLSCFDESCKDYKERIADVKNFEKTGRTPSN